MIAEHAAAVARLEGLETAAAAMRCEIAALRLRLKDRTPNYQDEFEREALRIIEQLSKLVAEQGALIDREQQQHQKTLDSLRRTTDLLACANDLSARRAVKDFAAVDQLRQIIEALTENDPELSAQISQIDNATNRADYVRSVSRALIRCGRFPKC